MRGKGREKPLCEGKALGLTAIRGRFLTTREQAPAQAEAAKNWRAATIMARMSDLAKLADRYIAEGNPKGAAALLKAIERDRATLKQIGVVVAAEGKA